MSGWVIILILAAAVMLGMWPWLRRDLGAMQFVAAALLVGFAGYTWQGSPGLAGAPKAQQAATPRPDSDFTQLRRDLFPQFDRNAAAISLSEGMMRIGQSEAAIVMLRQEIDKAPRNMVLWLGLADALIQHGGGALTPSANLAFDRAASLAPNHPAPHFFYALALARMGQFDQAETFFERVLQMPDTTDLWREKVSLVRSRIATIRGGAPTAQAAPDSPAQTTIDTPAER